MNVKIACAAVFGLAIVGAFVVGVSSTVSAQGKSQWDGIYSEEQAKRGEPLYAEKCSSCHGADMNGGEMAPGLAGGEFSANWNDLSLGDLFERMRISMPQNNPGSLSRQQNADILAAMLKKGNFPAGTTDLPVETDALKALRFVAAKP